MSLIDDPAKLAAYCLRPGDSIKQAVAAMNGVRPQCGLVLDEQRRLVGTLTDGDVRRGILAGVQLDEPVERIMFRTPTTAPRDLPLEQARVLMRARQVKFLPLLAPDRTLAGLAVLEAFAGPHAEENLVVLMAGGLGQRLRPLTDDCPKPMLRIGSKPILEIILESFAAQGFHRFAVSVNYKSEMVESYFGNGDKWDVAIEYIHEPRRMGTAGALSLLSRRPEAPFLVMNGDVLTTVRFRQLLDLHQERHAVATMCVRNYDVEVPFGVVEMEDGRLTRMVEKPRTQHFINAGIYVLSPEMLDHIPADRPSDMPDVLNAMARSGRTVAVFPIQEYWLDIGRHTDLERARNEVDRLFDDNPPDCPAL